VGGRTGVLEAAALVDGDVHQHRPRPHPGHQLVADQLRRLGTRDQHRADHQIGPGDHLVEGVRGGGQRLEPTLVERVHLAEALDVAVQQHDVRVHPGRHRRRVHPGDAGADHHHPGRGHSRDPAHQHAAAAGGPHQGRRPDLRGEPAGDLGHRGEQRQRSVRRLHRLVRDGGHAPVGERARALRRRREVQVGEEHLPAAHPVVLGLDRLLDLEDQVRPGPHLVRTVEDPGSGRHVLGVGDRRPQPGPGLDGDIVPVPGELADAGRGDGDPVLVVLDLPRDTDLHL
jgi:hypothetical protein